MVNALTPIPKVPSFEQNDDETALIGSGEFYLRTTTIFQGQNPKQLATPSSNPPLHTQSMGIGKCFLLITVADYTDQQRRARLGHVVASGPGRHLFVTGAGQIKWAVKKLSDQPRSQGPRHHIRA